MLKQTQANSHNCKFLSLPDTFKRISCPWLVLLMTGLCTFSFAAEPTNLFNSQGAVEHSNFHPAVTQCQGCHLFGVHKPTPALYRFPMHDQDQDEIKVSDIFRDLISRANTTGAIQFFSQVEYTERRSGKASLGKSLSAKPRSRITNEFDGQSVELERDVACDNIQQLFYSNNVLMVVGDTTRQSDTTNLSPNRPPRSTDDLPANGYTLVNHPGELENTDETKITGRFGWNSELSDPVPHQPPHQVLKNQILEARKPAERRSWEGIKSHGTLRMITMNRPTTFYLWRGEFAGFEYDLMSMFAQLHGLELDVLVVDGIVEAADHLNNGKGDMIAASLAPTSKRRSMGLAFSHSYLPVQEVIVARSEPVTRHEDLEGRTVHINPDTSFYENLLLLQSSTDFSIVRREHVSTERLVEEVAGGVIDLTVVDSHLFAAIVAVDDRLSKGLSISPERGLSWAVRDDQPELLTQLNEWIEENYRGREYNLTRRRYFENQNRMIQQFVHRIVGEVLSPFDDATKVVAERYEFDWRFITSQMYQESQFNPLARSHAGAIGLLQVLPSTAQDLDIEPEQLLQPDVAIETGVRYLHWVRNQFRSLNVPEQHWFALAAYNAGIGHVEDARKLADRLGLDKDRWFDNVELAMLKLAQPEYHQDAQYGYVRGKEPVEYVRKIQARYHHYVAHFAGLATL